MIVRLMTEQDLNDASLVHQAAFVRQQNSYEWLKCTHNAFPRMLCCIIEFEGNIVGYIVWAQKSGFRPQAVIELEQLAVHPDYQGKGFGQTLIKDSLELVKSQLHKQGSTVKHILVNTREDNHAQSLYRKVLGAEVEATIKDLYSANEVFMIARNI